MSIAEIDAFFKTESKEKPINQDEVEEIFIPTEKKAPPKSRPNVSPPLSSPRVREGTIKIKQDLLQYNKVDPAKGRSFLSHEFSQYGGTLRLIIILILMALAIGAFYLFQWVGTKTLPDYYESEDESYTEELEGN